ncbi:MAG: hypothetical protein LQ351_007817 [Letrouitia transgressa]|nr:MAG: hypothetical protein LQ351_007817 [Letrouitia transgressa]
MVEVSSTSATNPPASTPQSVDLISSQNTDRKAGICKGDVVPDLSAMNSRRESELLQSTPQEEGSPCKFNSTTELDGKLMNVNSRPIRFPVSGTSTVLYVRVTGIRLDAQTLRKLIIKTQSVIRTRQFVYGRYAPISQPFDVPYGPPHPLYFKAQAEDEKLLSWETLQNTITGLRQLLVVQRLNQEAYFTIHDRGIQVGSGSIWY